jgi:hypothetical protein
MELEILTQLGLVCGLATYIWNDAKKRNEKTEFKVDVLEKKVQKIEDIQGTKLDAQGLKIDSLSAEFKEFKSDINDKLEALRVALHKEENMENQLNTTLTLLLRELEKRADNQ